MDVLRFTTAVDIAVSRGASVIAFRWERPDDASAAAARRGALLGVRGDEANLLVDAAAVGAERFRVNRGGDVTFHGPGQLVGYPVMTVPGQRGGGMADTVAYVRTVEQLLIDVAAELGLATGRIAGSPGVWVDPGSRARKLAGALSIASLFALTGCMAATKTATGTSSASVAAGTTSTSKPRSAPS